MENWPWDARLAENEVLVEVWLTRPEPGGPCVLPLASGYRGVVGIVKSQGISLMYLSHLATLLGYPVESLQFNVRMGEDTFRSPVEAYYYVVAKWEIGGPVMELPGYRTALNAEFASIRDR